MKIGTIETIEPPKKRRKRRSGFTGTPGGGNKNNGGGGGGDDNNGSHPPDLPDGQSSPGTNIPRILTAFLLLVVMMTFGGLMSAYIVIATNGVPEWQPFALPIQVWISTGFFTLGHVIQRFLPTLNGLDVSAAICFFKNDPCKEIGGLIIVNDQDTV